VIKIQKVPRLREEEVSTPIAVTTTILLPGSMVVTIVILLVINLMVNKITTATVVGSTPMIAFLRKK
jgi:hypothetical protein